MKTENAGQRVFDNNWFNKYQKQLLWLLNTPIIKYWFRWVLRIRECDLPIKVKILSILPNCFTWIAKENISIISSEFHSMFKTEKEYRKAFNIQKKAKKYRATFYSTDFRTHPKFAKRLYFAFKPVWWFLHYCDLVWLDRLLPEYSFGFSTLTAYPDPNPETSTVDGRVRYAADNSTWATMHDATDGQEADDSSTAEYYLQIYSGSVSGWQFLHRSFFLFDTSLLTASATISAAVMSLRGVAKADGLSITPNIDIYTSSPASNTALVVGDFDQIGTVSQTGSPITYANFSTAGYNDFTFNATGISNISKTSISKFGARNATYDAANSEPPRSGSSLNSYLYGNFADVAGTTSDPKLVVTYTVPITHNKASFFKFF